MNSLSEWMDSDHQPLSSPQQGSVLEPPLFAIFTTPARKLINSYGSSYHQFADDPQDRRQDFFFRSASYKLKFLVLRVKSVS